MNNLKHDRQASGKRAVSQKMEEPAAASSPLRVLVRRRWQLLCCLLLVCTIAFAATVLRKPMYKAVARVQVEAFGSSPAAALLGGANSQDFNTQCELLQSRYVMGRAVQKLYTQSKKMTQTAFEERIDELQETVKVNPVSGSQLIDIEATAKTGDQAAAIANHLAEAFIETSMETRQAANSRVKIQLDKQLVGYDREIKELEEKVSKFRQENKITGDNSDLKAVMSRISQIEDRLTQSRLLRMELQAKQQRLQQMLAQGRETGNQQAALPEINNDPAVQSLQNTINNLEQQEMKLAQAYLPGHQKLRDVRTQITKLRNRLAEHKKNLMQVTLEEVAIGYTAALKQEQDFIELLREQKKLGVKLTVQQQQYRNLSAELELARRLKVECLNKIRQFTLQVQMNDSPVKVVDAAHTPNRTAGLSKSHQVASILLLGLLFSLGFVFAIDRLSDSPPEPQPQMFAAPMGGYQMAYWPGGYYPAPASMNAEPEVADSPPTETMAPMVVPEVELQEQSKAELKENLKAELKEEAKVETKEQTEPSISETLVVGSVGPMNLGAKSMNDAAFAARCRIVHTDQSGPAAGAFRRIVSTLLNRFGVNQQNVVVTGGSRQCGKTTCACNLALLLAQAGRNVLLVDASREAPVLKKVFKEPSDKPGFQDVLADIFKMDTALHQTDIPNLTVLGSDAGKGEYENPDVSDIWALVNNLSTRFDWIIYDAAVLENRWTKALLQTIGKSICIVSNSSPDQDRQITKKIEQFGAVTVGLIENHLRQEEPASH
ncbi:exopolysaccharide transport family protein [Planctomycetota bacterium]